MRLLAAVVCSMVFLSVMATGALGVIKSEVVTYKVGEETFKGVVVFDDAVAEKRPGVLVCHEWWGCNDFAKQRATKLAEEGYVAFALDMYGEGKVVGDAKAAGELAGKLYSDPKRLRSIATAGLKVLTDRKDVDGTRIGAIGFCMGGTIALELARTGADVKSVVTFHTSTLTAKDPAENKNIKAKVLVCDGAADTFLKPDERGNFGKQMTEAGVDWQMVSYGGAVHAFTNKDADTYKIPGVKYDEKAEKRSWLLMMSHFKETLGGKKQANVGRGVEVTI